MRTLLKLLSAAAGAALFATAAPAQGTIKIGWAIPKTGPSSASGRWSAP
jgi:hypothetical protein